MKKSALFALAAANDWDLHHVDIKTAFLYGNLDEEIYMQQPEGFKEGGDMVCHLTKAIYGLKQAPRAWRNEVKRVLCAGGFAPAFADPALFIRQEADGSYTYVDTYIDCRSKLGLGWVPWVRST